MVLAQQPFDGGTVGFLLDALLEQQLVRAFGSCLTGDEWAVRLREVAAQQQLPELLSSVEHVHRVAPLPTTSLEGSPTGKPIDDRANQVTQKRRLHRQLRLDRANAN